MGLDVGIHATSFAPGVHRKQLVCSEGGKNPQLLQTLSGAGWVGEELTVRGRFLQTVLLPSLL